MTVTHVKSYFVISNKPIDSDDQLRNVIHFDGNNKELKAET